MIEYERVRSGVEDGVIIQEIVDGAAVRCYMVLENVWILDNQCLLTYHSTLVKKRSKIR